MRKTGISPVVPPSPLSLFPVIAPIGILFAILAAVKRKLLL